MGRKAAGPAALALLLALLLAVPALTGGAPPTLTALRAESRVLPAQPSMITDFSGWYPLPVSGPSPVARTAGQMTFDSELGAVVLFGGCVGGGGVTHCASFFHDTWSYAHQRWTEFAAATAPAARAGGMIADDPAIGALVLFGGDSAAGPLNDTWEFQGGNWTQLHPVDSPPPRVNAALAYDTIDAALVLTGGQVGNATTGNATTWTFAGGEWTELPNSSPAPPGWIAPYLVPDPATGQLLLYGGLTAPDAAPDFGQTWEYADGRWTNETVRFSFTPAPRLWALGGFDPFTAEPLLFGGGTSTEADSDLWELQGPHNWTEEWGGDDPPAAFLGTESAWDPGDGYTVEFGNESSAATIAEVGAVSNQTWGLLSVLDIVGSSPEGTLPATVDTPVGFSASISGGLAPYQLAWDLGDGNQLVGDNFTHAYTRIGTFQVTLNVTDAVGQQLSEVLGIVTVSAVVAPPTPPQVTWTAYAIIAAEGAVVASLVVLALWWRRRHQPE